MDEVITQIQQWRTALLHIPNEDNDDIIPSASYHSEAYDKLFNSNKHTDCPESADNNEDNNTSIPYLADIDYIAKVSKHTTVPYYIHSISQYFIVDII